MRGAVVSHSACDMTEYGQHDIVLANSKLLSQYKCHGEAQVLQHHLETLHQDWLALVFG